MGNYCPSLGTGAECSVVAVTRGDVGRGSVCIYAYIACLRVLGAEFGVVMRLFARRGYRKLTIRTDSDALDCVDWSVPGPPAVFDVVPHGRVASRALRSCKYFGYCRDRVKREVKRSGTFTLKYIQCVPCFGELLRKHVIHAD